MNKRQQNAEIVKLFRKNMNSISTDETYIAEDIYSVINDIMYNLHVAIQEVAGLPHDGFSYKEFRKELPKHLS